jgi:hypothetical protein
MKTTHKVMAVFSVLLVTGIASGAMAYNGCRGTGLSVCNELVDPVYFDNHPSCQSNQTCRTPYYPCDSACPAPSYAETPKIMVKAAGVETTSGELQAMVIRDGQRIANYVDGNASLERYAWARLKNGVGLHTHYSEYVTAMCSVGWMGITRGISSMSVRWSDGRTQTLTCNDARLCENSIKTRGGFTATCNFIAK